MVQFLSKWPLENDLSATSGSSHYFLYYASLLVAYTLATIALRRKETVSQKSLGLCSLVAVLLLEAVCGLSLLEPNDALEILLQVTVLLTLCFGQIVCVLLSYLALTSIQEVRSVVGVTIAGYFICIPLLYALDTISGISFVVALLPLLAFICFRDLYPQHSALAVKPSSENGKLRFHCMAAVLVMSFVVGLLTSLEARNFFNPEEAASMFVHTTMMVLHVLFMVFAAKSKLLPRLSIVLISHIATKTVNLLYYYLSQHGLQLESSANVLLLCAGIAVCIAVYLLCFTSYFDFLALHRQNENKSQVGSAVEEISARHQLTRRETEVLHLLACGRSLPYIQSELCIAEGTARSHAHSIYRKLNVHTRQELIDLVEDVRSNDAETYTAKD